VNKAKELQLAFAAYGTASPWFDHYPKLAYDPLHNRFLVVFTRAVAADNYDVYGQLMNPDGTAFGPWFVICNALNIQSSPSVAYDTVNQRYLVVWHETDSSNYSNIYGQLVNADGTLYKTVSEFNFWISTAPNHQLNPSVAYDPANQRYLVAWQDYRNGWSFIYGQLVNADGTLYNTDSNTNFVISNGAQVQNYPSVAYDPLNQRFLVVWHEESGSFTNIWGQLVNANGTLYSTASDVNFVISNATNNQGNPSAAYDPVNQRFLVVWSDHRGGTYDIYGQLVNAAGTLYSTAASTNFVISNATYDQYLPSVAFDTANQRFLVVWQDYRINSISTDIYGQLVNAVGTLYDTASNVNFVISNPANYQYYPSVAYNSTCGNFLTAYETYETEVWDIGFAVTGPPCTTTYTVTTAATNGTITSTNNPTVNHGDTTTVTGSANANYYFAGVSGCGGTLQNNTDQSVTTFSYTTGAITGNCTVTANFMTMASNTPVGLNVSVSDTATGALITFSEVTAPGMTTVTISDTGPSIPSGFALASQYFDIMTTAVYPGSIKICLPYNEATVGSEDNLKLMHWNGTAWEDVTTSLDTVNNVICGNVLSLSIFAVMERFENGTSIPTMSEWGMIIFMVFAGLGAVVHLRRQKRANS